MGGPDWKRKNVLGPRAVNLGSPAQKNLDRPFFSVQHIFAID